MLRHCSKQLPDFKRPAGDAGRWRDTRYGRFRQPPSLQRQSWRIAGSTCRTGQRTRADAALTERIRAKFKIKNTCGYSLNALVDYQDPFEILQHLMIGSEGTLGFIAEITYHTVEEHSHKATALMIFSDIQTACEAVAALRPAGGGGGADGSRFAALSGEQGGNASVFQGTTGNCCGPAGRNPAQIRSLSAQVEGITASIAAIPTVFPFQFSDRPEEFTKLWAIRQGLFPSVGSARRPALPSSLKMLRSPCRS